MCSRWIILVVSLLFATGSMANITEHVVWDKTPIKITLPVGKERLLHFPEKFQFGYDATKLSADILTVLNVNGTLYLTAKKMFHVERCQIKLNSGTVILLDLAAQEQESTKPITVLLAEKESMSKPKARENPSPITLLRYAIRQLYAPDYLVPHNANIIRVPMQTTRTVALYRGDTATLMPLAQWTDGRYYVTALLVRNQLHQRIDLDPRRVRGNWLAASFFPHHHLSAYGSRADSSVLFLVSAQPFVNSLGV